MISRVTETRWSKLYVGVATLQCVIIIALQAVICSQNTYQASLLPLPTSGSALLSNTNDYTNIPVLAAERLGRIKWENVAFIGFQVWFIAMVFDATVYQNTAEIMALAVLNVICAVLGAMEVVDGVEWLNLLKSTQFSTQPLSMAEILEIVLAVVIMAFACVMAYLSYEMSRQFGWNIYKKIGADVQIQRMYRMFQFFVLALKIDIFTGFLVSLFYIIQFAIKMGITWESVIQLITTILMLPMLYLARVGGAKESKSIMVTFIAFRALVLLHYILVLTETFQPDNNWYTWIVLVFVGIFVDFALSVLGLLCMRNFGKGLKPYVQRGTTKQKVELEMNQSKAKVDWQIDDD